MGALENIDIFQARPCDIIAADQTELILADLHIPYHDTTAIECALNYADPLQPDIIILLGDILDFYQISVFSKKPANASVNTELQKAEKFLSDLRLRYPKSRIIYYLGNHEERLECYILKNADKLYDLVSDLLPRKLNLEKHRIELETQFIKIGHLYHLHGHEKPRGGNPQYITNVLWKYIHANFVVGHFHRSENRVFSHIEKTKRYMGCAVGWLALPEAAEYSRLNNWNQGFAIVQYDSVGNFKIDNRRVVSGEIY